MNRVILKIVDHLKPYSPQKTKINKKKSCYARQEDLSNNFPPNNIFKKRKKTLVPQKRHLD